MKELVAKLKKQNIKFEEGLSEEEIAKAESAFEIKFPKEIKFFLSYGLPVGDGFYNWRDCSKKNVELINDFQKRVEESFTFDLDNNNLANDFKDKFPNIKDEEELKRAIMSYLHSSPKLIPFYAHRCFFNGMDNMPIISYWQPTDLIFYGSDFENYIENEFLRKHEEFELGKITEKFQTTGIWKDLIC